MSPFYEPLTLIDDEESSPVLFWNHWWSNEDDKHKPDLYVVEQVVRQRPFQVSPTCNVLRSPEGFMPLNALLYRPDYNDVEAMLEEEHKTCPQGLVVLCGHPGIGKSMYLYALLASRLRRGLPTILQRPDGLYFFNRDGVYTCSKSGMFDHEQTFEGAWVLLDADPDFVSPAETLRRDPNFFFVMASSIDRKHTKWSKRLGMIFCHVPRWTWEEIVHARSFQPEPVADETELYRCFVDFGPCPLSVYGVNYERYRLDLELSNRELTYDTFTNLTDQAFKGSPSSSLSQKLFLVEPDPHPHSRIFTTNDFSNDISRVEPSVSIASPLIAKLLLEKSFLRDPEQLSLVYHYLSDRTTAPAARMLREQMNEHFQHELQQTSEVVYWRPWDGSSSKALSQSEL